MIKTLNIRQIVGDNVRCFRHKLNWSQEKLGLEVGLNHDYIGRLERGLENISIDNVLKIAIAAKIHPSVLLIENYCFEKFIPLEKDIFLESHRDILDGPKEVQQKIIQGNIKKM